MRHYPYLYNKTCKEHKEKEAVENAWQNVAEELDFTEDGKHSEFFVFGIAFAFLSSFFTSKMSFEKLTSNRIPHLHFSVHSVVMPVHCSFLEYFSHSKSFRFFWGQWFFLF